MTTMERHSSVHDVLNRMIENSFYRPLTADIEEGLLPVDISQTEKDIIVRASLPGFQREDVEVLLEKGVLSIKASRKEDGNANGERYYRRERHAGSLSRRVALPGMVQDHETTAELKDGMLTLRVPIAEEAKPKQIAVL
jgi:HSP20 family protein